MNRPHRHRTPRYLTLVCLLLALHAPNTWGQTPAKKKSSKAPAPVTLNFSNADIEAVARTMATLTGRNVMVDPRVKGTMTLNTEGPTTPSKAYNLFLSTLRMQGFAVVQTDGLDKIVPESEAKLHGGAAPSIDAPTSSGSLLITQIIKLKHENAANLVAVLRPLINPNNPINVNASTNSLVITDYADNLRRLTRMIEALDTPNATDIEIINLRYATATDIAPLVQRLVDSANPGAGAPGNTGDSGFKTTIIAEPRSNTLILRAATPARLALVQSLVSKLDQPQGSSNGEAGNIYVVYLKNANATQLATTLRAALSANASPSASAGTSPAASTANAGNNSNAPGGQQTGGQIQADVATNALIITANEPQYRQLRAVIDKLDARRAQVFVESLIAEVNADKAAEFGVQWQGAIGKAGDATIGLLGTNFGSGGKNILTLATQGAAGTVSPSRGLNMGAVTQNNGVYTLGALARFIEETGSGNVLSTPNLLTLDNEEAKIVIGQNVPFVTGQFTNTGAATATVNPFQTIERKDVGLTLKVRPQISEDGTVKLTIYQEVSSVQASTATATNGPTTNKRTIESNVLVQDGSVVVLGGLLQDEYANGQEKVPGLGDIPLLGALFRSESQSRRKTNLMVFLRPVVIRDNNSSDRLTLDRYEQMRGIQQDSQPTGTGNSNGPLDSAPMLPAVPKKTVPAP